MQLILTSTSDYWMSRHCLKTLLEVKLLSTSVGTVSSPLDHDINKGHHSDVKVVQVSIVHFTWQSLSVSVNRTRMTVCNMDSHHLWYWKGKCVLLQTMFQEVLNMLLLNVPLEIWKKTLNIECFPYVLIPYTIPQTLKGNYNTRRWRWHPHLVIICWLIYYRCLASVVIGAAVSVLQSMQCDKLANDC